MSLKFCLASLVYSKCQLFDKLLSHIPECNYLSWALGPQSLIWIVSSRSIHLMEDERDKWEVSFSQYEAKIMCWATGPPSTRLALFFLQANKFYSYMKYLPSSVKYFQMLKYHSRIIFNTIHPSSDMNFKQYLCNMERDAGQVFPNCNS